MKSLLSLSLAIASLLAVPGGALASDHATGTRSTVNVPIDDASNWVVITKATVSFPNQWPTFDTATHGCVVNASADVSWPGGSAADVENRYRFVLSLNNYNPTIDSGTERTLATVDHAGVNDPSYYPISTTLASTGLTKDNGLNGGGQHTFYFLGRKVLASDPPVTAVDYSISLICVDPS
jgi:hypothetical protein